MKHGKNAFSLIGLIGLIILLGAAHTVVAQDRETFSKDDIEKAKAEYKNNAQKSGPEAAAMPGTRGVFGCIGPITRVIDIGYEGVKVTSANYFANPGGGEGGGFDKTPILSTTVQLGKETCLDAHFSAMVGSKQSYGVAPITMFQVTLTPVGGGPTIHMFGHFERPYN